VSQPAPKIPSIALLGLAPTTRVEHRRVLAHLTSLPADLLDAPADIALVEWLSRRRKQRRWRGVSTAKNAACVQGAFRLLPMYRTGDAGLGCGAGLRLGLSPVWQQFVRATSKMARAELPCQPKAATTAQVAAVLAMQDLPEKTRMAILLGWVTTQRIGCIRQLAREDLVLNAVTRTVSVRFRKGKVVAARGPYTVHSAPISLALWEQLQQFLASAPPAEVFRSLTGAMVKLALRRVDRQLEQRSLRRGAVQAQAAAPGMKNDVLLAYTGHVSLASLFRYLNWGLKARHVAAAQVTATGGALAL
jgi:hypothetical protein